MKHAKKLSQYQNRRGGHVKIFCIDEPEHQNIESAIQALTFSLEIESKNAECLNCLYKIAEHYHDLDAMDFIVKDLIHDQVKQIAELNVLLTRVKEFSDDIGIYLIDRELKENKKREI